MSKLVLYTFLVLLVFICAEQAEGLNRVIKYRRDRHYAQEQASELKGTASADANEDTSTRRGLGVSAWGLITIVISLILAIAGMYYFSICYPVLCKKNKRYDIMGLTPA